MDENRCSNCGKELAPGEGLPCPECRKATADRGKKRRWCLAGAMVLLLTAGALLWRAQAQGWDFSWAALTGQPVAVVNGEEISRAAFGERLAMTRGMLERQYGKGLFAGEEGQGLLAELGSDVLEKMIGERLVEQEARHRNLAVSDEQVRQTLDAIGKEVYGSPENMQASLREEGISPGYISGHIRNMLLRQAVEQAERAGVAGSSARPGFWLAQARQEAKITLNRAVGPSRAFARGAGSCCGSAGAESAGGCGGGTAGSQAAPELEKAAAAAALAAFGNTNAGAKGLRTKVTDYGCHLQVDIEEGGKVVRSYNYQNGKVSEI